MVPPLGFPLGVYLGNILGDLIESPNGRFVLVNCNGCLLGRFTDMMLGTPIGMQFE